MPRTVLLGHVLGAHGIRGDVLIRVYSDDPDAAGSYRTLTTADGARTFEIVRSKATPKGLIVAFKEIGDRTAAEALKGLALHVPRSALPRTAEREFYHADLIGLRVLRPDGSALGAVVGVANFGAGDLLEVRIDGHRTTQYVPFGDDFVPALDLDAGTLVVDLPQLDRVDEAGEDE